MEYKCISADGHIDLHWLPPDLFTANASTAMKERMPHIENGPEGPTWVAKRGGKFGFACGVGGGGRKYSPGKLHRADRMAQEGLYSDASRSSRRLTDPHQRIKDQDRDGVQAEVLFGILGATNRLNDPEAAPEMYRIYNEWLASFCAHFPDRLLGLASLPGNDVNAAVAEAKRAATLGLKGLELATSYEMIPLFDPQWEPLWNVIDDTGLPIHFHTMGGPRTVTYPAWTKHELRINEAVLMTGFQLITANFLMAMIYGGVLERHPGVRIVLGESGIGWIPYILDRMDFEWGENFQDLGLKIKPSEYWRRQCKATFQYDEIGLRLRELLGEETLMWGSDFPHPDGVWPDSQEFIAKQFSHLPPEVRRKIVCGNAVSLYKLA